MSTSRPRRARNRLSSDLAEVWPARPPVAEKDHLAVIPPVRTRTPTDLADTARGALRYGLATVGLAPGRAAATQAPTVEQITTARAVARDVLDALGLTTTGGRP